MRKLVLILATYYSLVNLNVCYSHSEGLQLGDILWQIVVPDNPGTTNQDKQIKSLKQIPDINGDHITDVIVATGNYWTLCLNGVNGNIIWQFSTHFGTINTGSVEWEDALDIVDINNDGTYEVVIGCAGGNEMVYALNGSNGNRIWDYGDSISTNDGDIESVKIKYDYNHDGYKDVLVAASGVINGGRHASICLNGLNGQVIFYRTEPQPFTDDIVPLPFGGAVGVNNNGAPYGVTGFDTIGNQMWSYTASGNIWSLKETADISGDGRNDILGLCGFSGAVFGISGYTGSQVWSRSLGSSNNGKITLLDDADGNGYADFTLSAPQSAFRLDAKTGNTIWSNALGSSFLRGVDNIGDITNDSIDDIVIATQLPPRLVVLNGINGNILFNHDFGTTLTQRGDRAAVLNDIDSNGVNEFLGGNREGKVICFYGGNGNITSVGNNFLQPVDFKLQQNFPNPFNPSTIINYELSSAANVRLTVYDIQGKEVKVLFNGKRSAGKYQNEFNAENLSGGVYFCELEIRNDMSGNTFRQTRKMLLVK